MSSFEFLNIEEEKMIEHLPVVEILHKVRDWDKAWIKYFESGIRPMNFTEFIEMLNKEYEVKKRVPNDTAN